MPLLPCLFCQHLNPAGAVFCNECGKSLNLQPCAHCEAVNDRAATSCQKCGAELAPAEPQALGSKADGSPDGASSPLWSKRRNGGLHETVLSEMGATTNAMRRRMFIAVLALLLGLVTYVASVYFYGQSGHSESDRTTTPDRPGVTGMTDGSSPGSGSGSGSGSEAHSPPAKAPPAAEAPLIPAERPPAPAENAVGPEKPPPLAPPESAATQAVPALPAANEQGPSSPAPPALKECPPAVAALGFCGPESQQEKH